MPGAAVARFPAASGFSAWTSRVFACSLSAPYNDGGRATDGGIPTKWSIEQGTGNNNYPEVVAAVCSASSDAVVRTKTVGGPQQQTVVETVPCLPGERAIGGGMVWGGQGTGTQRSRRPRRRHDRAVVEHRRRRCARGLADESPQRIPGTQSIHPERCLLGLLAGDGPGRDEDRRITPAAIRSSRSARPGRGRWAAA